MYQGHSEYGVRSVIRVVRHRVQLRTRVPTEPGILENLFITLGPRKNVWGPCS